MFCKSGRHRSVSNAKLFYDLIKETYEVDAELLHLSDGPNWRHLCGNCPECSWKEPAARKVADQVMDAAREHWYNFVPKVWVRKDGQRRLGDDGPLAQSKREPIVRKILQVQRQCRTRTAWGPSFSLRG